jgi:hypothetical protein
VSWVHEHIALLIKKGRNQNVCILENTPKMYATRVLFPVSSYFELLYIHTYIHTYVSCLSPEGLARDIKDIPPTKTLSFY